MLPSAGIVGNKNGGVPGVISGAGLNSLQLFTETEVSAMTAASGVSSLLPYGYVVRNVNDPSTRALPANPPANDYEGSVTLGVAFPSKARRRPTRSASASSTSLSTTPTRG